ncbi:putative glutamine amidotransferase [Streptacidiphilus sp. MAP12-16]|uniref:hypothetical protein n=1 Tax=Streptacidiphilus sp. MAP12-16 TaxID=3156300 RepID=UPI003518F0DD
MSVDVPLPETDAMSDLSRRGLIRNAAGAGAAGLAAGVLLNAAAGTAQAAEPRSAEPSFESRPGERPVTSAETLIVHVRDAKTGELDIYHGHQHRVVRDRKLAAALLRAAG